MPINSVTIVGNLTRDPELRGLPSGGSVCSMRVAVNERRKDQSGQWVDAPNFFNVTVFGNSADNAAKYLAKGRQVAVAGRLRWREWQDKEGNKRESIEIVANDVQFIGGREGGPGGPPPSGQQGGGWGGPPAGGGDDWGGPPAGGGGQAPPQGGQQGGYSGGGSGYNVDQGDFGGPPPQSAPPATPAPGGAPAPADDDIPF